MKKNIYMDNGATTKMSDRVRAAMEKYFAEEYGNPSSAYGLSLCPRELIKKAREGILETLGAKEGNVFFTGGGTESDNWAVKGAAFGSRGHMITSRIEHPAIMNSMKFVEKYLGYDVTYLNVDEYGMVRPKELEAAIREDTRLVSIMLANNEIGTIEPIAELAGIAKSHGVLFHTDAVQAYGQIPVDVEKLGVDFLSASGHKIYGPKGTGFLYVREPHKWMPFINGGGQEAGFRAGTENVPGIAGIFEACREAMETMAEREKKEKEIRDYIIKRVLAEIPYCRLNGHPLKRLPGNVNFSFQFVEGGSLVLNLDMLGIETSSGSACSAKSSNPSHVLMACHLPSDIAYGSLRISLGKDNSMEEAGEVVAALKKNVEALRSMSPFYEEFAGK